MKTRRLTSRAYKEVTFQQLRSFCETARMGSLKAAAKSLGVAQPTVWKQVHALERLLDVELLEGEGRGSRLTAAGELLASLAGPSVSGIASLKRKFEESWQGRATKLVMVTIPKIMNDHIPECILKFQRKYPDVDLTVREMNSVEQVSETVEAGHADFGLMPDPWPTARSPLLIFEHSYNVCLLLITPKDHPLAKKREIRPSHLAEYPMVNSPGSVRDQGIDAVLKRLAVYQRHPCSVEATMGNSVVRYVELGFGIGLAAGLGGRNEYPSLHVRDMSRYFEPIPVFSVWRRRASEGEPAHEFAELIREMLGSKQSRGR